MIVFIFYYFFKDFGFLAHVMLKEAKIQDLQ